MSVSQSDPQRKRPKAETLIIVAMAALILFALIYVMSQRQQALRSSPAGFDGLQTWLTSEGVSAQRFLGGWQIDPKSIGILVVPLFDTRLDTAREFPRSKEELLLQQDEYDLEIDPVLEKASRVPTLVVLPKWRSGMRLTGLAHPVLLSDRRLVEQLLQQVTGDSRARIEYAGTAFSDFDYMASGGNGMSVTLYAAQMLTNPDCIPVIGSADAMVLAECPLSGGGPNARVLVLSDPDLLNNHGLRLAANAIFARDFLGARAGERNVVIDYSRDVWLMDPERGVRSERTWADLMRFFDPPFLTLWFGGFLVLGLFVWRASLRYGPAIRDRAAATSGKSLAVEARARLMRLSDQDGALIGEYARARLAATAALLFGPAHARDYASPEAFLGYVERRHPAYASGLHATWSAIRNLPARISPAEAIRHVDDLEALLEQITNDT